MAARIVSGAEVDPAANCQMKSWAARSGMNRAAPPRTVMSRAFHLFLSQNQNVYRQTTEVVTF